MIYHVVDLNTPTLTAIVEVESVNKDGTINTKETKRLMLLSTLNSIGFGTQKEAELQAAKNFISMRQNKLMKTNNYHDYVKSFVTEHYPELLI